MSATHEFLLDLRKLRPHPLRDRLPPDPEPPCLREAAHVREAEEVERLRFPVAPSPPMPGSVPPELDEPGLLGMQLQPELREPLAKIGKEPPCIGLVLETNGEIIGEPDGDHVTLGEPVPPPLDPQDENVVQVHISEQRRCRCPLRCA